MSIAKINFRGRLQMLNERQDPKYLVQHHPDGKRRAHDVQGIETTSCVIQRS